LSSILNPLKTLRLCAFASNYLRPENSRGPLLLALLGGLVYALQAILYAQTQASVLDEGLYLYKGWLFATGRYTPFQEFGPWTNHMPLSFLIPGWVQLLFGAGLRTGRGLAILLGLCSVAGVWLLTRRLAEPRYRLWWAAIAVWAIALNPALIKIYSVMASQGLAAFLIIAVVVLTLGEERPTWQLVIGAGLAGAVPLTRINLLPVMPLVLAYIYWQYGRKTALQATAAAAIVFVAGHLIFWPNILRMWTPWFPQALTPFLDTWRRPAGVVPGWQPQIALSSRVQSLFQGVRFHYISLLGALGLLIFWPETWGGRTRFRTTVFLLVALGLMTAMHAWVSLGQDYCVFCFPVYLSFFSLLGIVMVAVTLPYWRSKPRWPVVAVILLVLALGMGYSAADLIGAALVDQPLVRQVMLIDLPRVAGVGGLPLWGLIANRFDLTYEQVIRLGQIWGRIGVSMAAAAGGMLVLLFVARRTQRPAQSAWRLALIAGLLLSPWALFGGGYRTYDCTGDVITAYESAGAYLEQTLPEDAQVYWAIAASPVPLLYLPDAKIYPQQLNGVYSFRKGGEPQAMAAFGLWNIELAEIWVAQADAVLVPESAFNDPNQAWLIAMVESGPFDEQPPTSSVHPCSSTARFHIFLAK
jgi:hypothetical protein